jgi:hypothetical protein
MDFWNRMRRLEDTMSKTVDGLVQRGSVPRLQEPLDVMLRILDAVEAQVQHAGRGTRVFPFTRVDIAVAAADHEQQARLEAVFDHEPGLNRRVTERLAAAGCAPANLTVSICYQPRDDTWEDPCFDLRFARLAPAPAEPATLPEPPGSMIELQVITGDAGEAGYACSSGGPINIGRRQEVLGADGRLLRINHLAFADDAANSSVSRRHAHLVRERGTYSVIDDRSARGTCVIREGRSIEVPAGGRGLLLQSGDELAVGEARVRVIIRPRP